MSIPPSNTTTRAALARRFDHTLLKPEATAEDIRRAMDEAIQYRFASLCIAPMWVSLVADKLRAAGVATCTVAGFPHGTSKTTVKAIEATVAVKDGANEIDVVASLPDLARRDLETVRASLLDIVKACRAARRETIIKVIIESAYLMSLGPDQGEAAIATACRAIRESGCDFVKTSTGYHPAGGVTIEAVTLIKKHSVGLQIKASGGIRTLESAMSMLNAGADRLGTSASVSILHELIQ